MLFIYSADSFLRINVIFPTDVEPGGKIYCFVEQNVNKNSEY